LERTDHKPRAKLIVRKPVTVRTRVKNKEGEKRTKRREREGKNTQIRDGGEGEEKHSNQTSDLGLTRQCPRQCPNSSSSNNNSNKTITKIKNVKERTYSQKMEGTHSSIKEREKETAGDLQRAVSGHRICQEPREDWRRKEVEEGELAPRRTMTSRYLLYQSRTRDKPRIRLVLHFPVALLVCTVIKYILIYLGIISYMLCHVVIIRRAPSRRY
jgi:hypothetical protein